MQFWRTISSAYLGIGQERPHHLLCRSMRGRVTYNGYDELWQGGEGTISSCFEIASRETDWRSASRDASFLCAHSDDVRSAIVLSMMAGDALM